MQFACAAGGKGGPRPLHPPYKLTRGGKEGLSLPEALSVYRAGDAQRAPGRQHDTQNFLLWGRHSRPQTPTLGSDTYPSQPQSGARGKAPCYSTVTWIKNVSAGAAFRSKGCRYSN